MTTWATVNDVFIYTGVTSSPDQVAQAQGVVELFSGVGSLTKNISNRDLRLLKMAVAYQTGFIVNQPEVFGRMGIQSFSQDGTSFSLASNAQGQPDTDALLISSLTRRCVSQLSWNRSRSVKVARPRSMSVEEYSDKWLKDEVGNRDWRPVP